jgi:hypothetical protein
MKPIRTRANVLLAASVWTLWVWGTRIWNILDDPSTTAGFKVVHTVLAVVSVAFAAALAVIGVRMHREAGAANRPRETVEPRA